MNVETGDLTGILACMTLSIVEVGRNSEGGVVDEVMCLGPEASVVMKGKVISVRDVDEGSILAFSEALRIRQMAIASPAAARS